MSTIKKTNDESHPIIEDIYKDIKQTRNTSYIGNFWKYLAFDPNLLKNVWTDIKNIMVKESIIPNKTKEMIYMAVSITNNCSYCTHSHTAAAKKLGMTSLVLMTQRFFSSFYFSIILLTFDITFMVRQENLPFWGNIFSHLDLN